MSFWEVAALGVGLSWRLDLLVVNDCIKHRMKLCKKICSELFLNTFSFSEQ